MKSFVFALLGLMLSFGDIWAQGTTPRPGPVPAAINPPVARDDAVTSYNPNPAPARPAGPASAQGPGKPGVPGRADAAYIPSNPPSIGLTSLWDLVKQGGWPMFPLIGMSVLAVMLTLVFFLTLRRSTILTAHYMNTADVLLKKRDYLGLLAISSRHGEVIARVVQRTLDFATKNPSATFEVVKDVAESEGASQASSLQHRVTYLADIGTLSPMVGLFGTVVGIVDAFGNLGKSAGVDREWGMASGVSQALIATGAGLVIGIVAFTFYAYFRNKVQRLISDLEVASSHVVGLMALNYKRRETSRAALEEEF